MATAMAAATLADAAPDGERRRTAFGPTAGIMRGAMPAIAASPLTAMPLLLGPSPPSAAQVLTALAAMLLFFLLDLGTEPSASGRILAPVGLVLAAGGLGTWLGEGLPVFALLFLSLKLCGRHWRPRSAGVAAAFAAAVAVCRVDAGYVAIGQPGAWWLMLAAAGLAAFAALAAAPTAGGTRPAGADVRVPSHRRQCREVCVVGLLAASVAAGLALLGSSAATPAFKGSA